ncbi:MAG: LVIVD repeat-containing protein [Candidatus Heimdallarchaeaceae archaeon]
MQKKFRVMLGIFILILTSGSAIAVGVMLPIQTIKINNQIEEKLNEYGMITEDDLDPYEGGSDNYSDWMYVAKYSDDSNYYAHTYIEFYNISDRNAYLYKNTPITYIGIPGKLVFDLEVKKFVIDYSEENDYVVYTERKQYTLNKTLSTLTGNEKIINYNYLWPYYVKNFGNGSEYGLQAYVAGFMIRSELEGLGYNNSEIAKLVLNKAYAQTNDLIYSIKYSPHMWINSRPDHTDINFDSATAYKILFNAITADGHDYSLFTGEAGSMKYFLDLVQGLSYDPSILTINVTQKLAEIYDIDTPEELEQAQSFAAYIRYLTGTPALNWLYENKISYICERTALEWVTGVEDPLLGGKKYPFLVNQSFAVDSVDPSTDLLYAVKTGRDNITKVDEIIGIANIPTFEESQSYKVEMNDEFAYVIEGNRGFRIVNTSSPLFLGIGGYRLQGYFFRDIAFETSLYGDFAYVAAGEKGIVSLDMSDLTEIDQITVWTNGGDINALDLEYNPTKTFMLIAMGQYGLAKATTNGGDISLNTLKETESPVTAVVTDGTKVYAVEQGRGIEVFDAVTLESLANVSLTGATQLLLDGTTLYVLDDTLGLVVYSISGNTLTQIGTYDFGVSGGFFNLYQNNDLLYLTAGENGLIVVDASNVNSLTSLATYDSDGEAYDIYASGENIYLADGSKGLIHITYSSGSFSDVLHRDELRTFVEIWDKASFVQLNNWPMKTTQFEPFSETYGLDVLPPNTERGFTQRWVEYFYRPFIFDSARDKTIMYGRDAYIYYADTQQPYLQVDQYDLYWQEYADYLNESFVHVGRWNQIHGTDWKNDDIYITHTFPGSIRDEFHFQQIFTDPTTGTILERRDRVQYNTYAGQYIEYYPFLDEDVVEDTEDIQYKYRTWHQTYPKLTADMANLFWLEDILYSTDNLAKQIEDEFLSIIGRADSYRTGGAFAALFILTLGIIVSSLTINPEPVKQQLFHKKK